MNRRVIARLYLPLPHAIVGAVLRELAALPARDIVVTTDQDGALTIESVGEVAT